MTTSRTCASVLVVEDARDLRERVVRFLKREGFQVYGAAGREQALIALGAAPRPTLVLADLLKPDIDAPLLLEALERDDRLATLPVVVLSTDDPRNPAGFRHDKKLIDLEDLLKIVEGLCTRRT